MSPQSLSRILLVRRIELAVRQGYDGAYNRTYGNYAYQTIRAFGFLRGESKLGIQHQINL